MARWSAVSRALVVVVALPVLLMGCGDAEMSLGEYAAEVEELVHRMNGRLDDLEAEHRAAVPTIGGVAGYHEARAATRLEFLEGLTDLDAPDEVTDLHDATVDIVTQLADAQNALADRAHRASTVYELADIFDTPEGLAFLAIDEQAIALCRAAQTEMDETEAREMFGETPWVPAELQEVVIVALKCTVEDRTDAG